MAEDKKEQSVDLSIGKDSQVKVSVSADGQSLNITAPKDMKININKSDVKEGTEPKKQRLWEGSRSK